MTAQQLSATCSFESADGATPGSAWGPPELEPPRDQPSAERQPGPSGLTFVSATVAMFAFVGVIFLLLGVGGATATGGAILVMVLGLVVVARYVQRISWTRSSPKQARGLGGVSEDGSGGEDGYEELSPYDFPRENPARQQLEREAA